MKMVFATQNLGKIKEMRNMLKDLPIELVSAKDAGIETEVDENGETLEDNALKKAQFVTNATRLWAIADDTGLFIDALDGAPGIHAKRWGGDAIPSNKLVEYTLEQMKKIPEGRRGASFISVVAIATPDGKSWTFRGELKGRIATTPRGSPRITLPYDTLFIPSGEERTFAEMSDTEKNAISHRGRAFQQVIQFLHTSHQ